MLWEKKYLAKLTFGMRGLFGLTVWGFGPSFHRKDSGKRKTTGHIASAVRKQGEIDTNGLTFSSLFILSLQPMQWYYPHSQ